LISKISFGKKTSEVVENADESSFGEGQVMNMIRKGQVEGIGKGDIRGQVRFMADLFKVAA